MNHKSKEVIKFVYEQSDTDDSLTPQKSVAHTISGESSLDECIEAFENFLLGCGYRLHSNNTIGIIEQ